MNTQGKKFHAPIVILGLLLAIGVAVFPVTVASFKHAPEVNYFSCFLFSWKWMFMDAKSAPFAACAFLCFLVSGIFWYRASGLKKIFCYLLFLCFAIMVGFGTLSFEFALGTMPGDTRLKEPTHLIMWSILGAGVLAMLLVEGVARLLYPPEK